MEPRILLYLNILIFTLSGFSLFFFYEKWEPVIFENEKEGSVIIQSPTKPIFVEEVEELKTITQKKVSIGEDFVIPIGVEGLENNLSSAFIKLSFDPSKIKVSEIKKGNIFIGDDYYSEFNYDIDNKLGIVIVGVDVLTSIASDKNGNIVEVTAQAIKEGESLIEFKDVAIFDFSGEKVNYSINPIELIIN